MNRYLGTLRVLLALTMWPATSVFGQAAATTSARSTHGPEAALLEDYRIGPEDILDIVVWKTPELARTVQVRPDGRISLPLINDLQAAALTPMELQAALTKGYLRFIADPEVSVIVKEVHSRKVSVIGMVKTAGRFELPSQATVLDALALAGGFADFAKRDRILVRRRDGTSLLFNYSKVLDNPEAKDNILVQPGDIIIVP